VIITEYICVLPIKVHFLPLIDNLFSMEVPTEQVITLNGGTESSRSYSEVADQEMCGES